MDCLFMDGSPREGECRRRAMARQPGHGLPWAAPRADRCLHQQALILGIKLDEHDIMWSLPQQGIIASLHVLTLPR